MAETPDLFKADPQIEKLNEGGLLLIWNEEPRNAAGTPMTDPRFRFRL